MGFYALLGGTMKKKLIPGLILALWAALATAGCGSDFSDTDAVADSDAAVTETAALETAEEAADGSFGLQDFEGFYFETVTEEMEGVTLSTIYGYELEGDGNGTFYGQDNIKITWNETEIHFPDSVLTYDMEPGKLIVHNNEGDVTYEKLEGSFIKPNDYDVDVTAPEDGTYPAEILSDSLAEIDGNLVINFGLYTEDTYDVVEVSQMAEGDMLYVDGRLLEVESAVENEYGGIDINGGMEGDGASLSADEESSCYRVFEVNDASAYTLQGQAALTISADAAYTDNCDPTVEKSYTGGDIKTALEADASEGGFTPYNCRITVTSGEITEISRIFTP